MQNNPPDTSPKRSIGLFKKATKDILPIAQTGIWLNITAAHEGKGHFLNKAERRYVEWARQNRLMANLPREIYIAVVSSLRDKVEVNDNYAVRQDQDQDQDRDQDTVGRTIEANENGWAYGYTVSLSRSLSAAMKAAIDEALGAKIISSEKEIRAKHRGRTPFGDSVVRKSVKPVSI